MCGSLQQMQRFNACARMQRSVHNPSVPVTPLHTNQMRVRRVRYASRHTHQRALLIASTLRRCMTGGRA